MNDDETAVRELLHRVTPDLGSLNPPAEPSTARSSRRPTLLAVSAAVAVVAIVAIVLGIARQLGPSGHRSGPGSPNRESERHPLTVQIQLDRTTATAGQAISGVAIVTNAAKHPLTIIDCKDWIQVVLGNANVTPHAVFDLCRGTTIVQPGTTRIPITVYTTYLRCTPHADSVTTQLPACEPGTGAMPPLPPGTYNTTTAILEPKGVQVPTPASIEVTLTP